MRLLFGILPITGDSLLNNKLLEPENGTLPEYTSKYGYIVWSNAGIRPPPAYASI